MCSFPGPTVSTDEEGGGGVTGTSGRSSSVAAFVFFDLVESTALLTQVGDAAYDELRRRCDRAWRRAIERAGGEEVKHLGDGMMAVFDSAVAAVDASAELHRTTSSLRSPGTPLHLRVGASLGEATRDGNDWFGTPVVEAARLCGASAPDQTLVSEAIRLLAAPHCDASFEPTEPLMLKGLGQPVIAHSIVWPHPEAPRLPNPLAVLDDRPFVGRDEQLAVVRRAWRDARGGRLRLVLIGGEPGIGKTHFSAAAAAEAASGGGAVLYGRCDDEIGVPYQPFAEALSLLAGQLAEDDVADLFEDPTGDLARILPSVRSTGVLTSTSGPELDPELARQRSFDAVTQLLSRASERVPLLVVLDDLHWATKPTMLLLRHLVRSDKSMSVLIVGTYRDTDLDSSRPLTVLLPQLRREAGVDALRMRGLTQQDVAALVGAMASHDLDERAAELAAALHTETGGNPLFISEVLHHLADIGVIHQRDGRWTSDVQSLDDLDLPEGVRDAITARLGLLSDTASQVLRVAAVAGPHADLSTLEALCPDVGDGLLDALDEAVAAGVLSDLAGARYMFTHAVIRHTVYSSLASARRVRLHRMIGEALEARGAPADVLAHHFAEGAWDGGADRAARYALEAARQALDHLAFEEAVLHLDRGLTALDTAPEPDHARRADLLIALGDAHARALETVPARETARRAAEAARLAGSPRQLGEAALVAADVWGIRVGSPDPELEALLEGALKGNPEESILRSRLLAGLANYRSAAIGRAHEALQLVDESIAIARREGDPSTLAFVLMVRCNVLQGLVEPEEILRIATDVIELLSEAPDHRRHIQALQYVWRANLELGIAAGDADEELSRATAATSANRLVYLTTRAAVELLGGHFDTAEAMFTEAMSLTDVDPNVANIGAGGLLQVYRERGQLADFLPLVVAAAEGNPQLLAYRCARASIEAELGNVASASDHLAALSAGGFASIPRDNTWLGCHALLAEAATGCGDAASARVLYGIMKPHAGRMVLVGNIAAILGAVDRYLGMTAATFSDPVAARGHYERALEIERSMPAPPLAARTELWLAKLLIDDEPSRARTLLESSRSTASALGMQKLRADTEALLGEASAGPRT